MITVVFSGWHFKSWNISNNAFKSLTAMEGEMQGGEKHIVSLNNSSNVALSVLIESTCQHIETLDSFGLWF